jgi:alpha-amylase/alpha-mannosidase (GH57 family)
VLEGDRESRKRFSGHGSALAQVYNHMILPLANGRDRRTQVLWGIRDFYHRFGRRPEGIWLPETAVDIETLELLAEHEIKFTSGPALAAAAAHDGRRRDVSGGRVDLGRTGNACRRAAHRQFFYDGRLGGGRVREAPGARR